MTSNDNINAGKPWEKHEDLQLAKLYIEDKLDLISISKIHQRAPGGIISRLVKNKIVSDKRSVRGYDDYLKIDQTNEKKIIKNKEKPEEKINQPDEIIMIENKEFFLSNNTVYEIVKTKGSIYGLYDSETCTVRELKQSIKNIITFITSNSSIQNVLWTGADLDLVTGYCPNVIFTHLVNASDLTKYDLCVGNMLSNEENTINHHIGNLVPFIRDYCEIIISDNKNYFDETMKILQQNKIKVIDKNQTLTNKLFWTYSIKKPTFQPIRLMVLDTETTGFPLSRDPSNYNLFNCARLIELGYIIYDVAGTKLKEIDSLVKPNNFSIGNSHIHGITQQDAITNGKSIGQVLSELDSDLDNIDGFVCHNISFDMDIILAEAYRAKNTNLIKKIESKKRICTMEIGKKFMGLNKKPKLVNLYKFLFNEEFEQEHRALSDCVACAKCYFEMTM